MASRGMGGVYEIKGGVAFRRKARASEFDERDVPGEEVGILKGMGWAPRRRGGVSEVEGVWLLEEWIGCMR